MTPKNSILRRAIRRILPKKEWVDYRGSVIPSPDRRWCGPEFKDDEFYIKSAEKEAHRLIDNLGCAKSSRILDVGCGQGRLPIGLLRVIGEVAYMGLDIDQKSIEWCKRHIQHKNPSFKFKYLNLYNERYNKQGVKTDKDFKFELESKSVDLVYLFSVFSHTTEEDMRIYLDEFTRVLGNAGKMFFTTFVEDNVPNISFNPENYRLKCSGPLHVVRYNKDYLFSLLKEHGFSVLNFSHASEADGQSAIYLSRSKAWQSIASVDSPV